MSIEQLITFFGYPVILIGTILEGETVLVVGGYMARRGYLSLPWVMVVAGVGAIMGDQFFFHVGRRYGRRVLERRPNWRPRADRARRLLESYEVPVLLGFRFLYGLRMVMPFVIGWSGFSPRRFLVYNVIGAAAWAVIIGGAGYLFGAVIEQVFHEVRRYELLALGVVVAVGATVWIVHLVRLKRTARASSTPPG